MTGRHPERRVRVSSDNEPTHERLFERLFGNFFSGSGRIQQEDKVREYILHRLNHGAHLAEVLQEKYVLRNCSRDEVDEIIRDPRLIHEDREGLKQLFESGELDPVSIRRLR